MTGELYINGQDAWTTWGVNMGDGFIDALEAPAPMKAHIENASRTENGKRVIASDPKVDTRSVTLQFAILGDTPGIYRSRKKAFYDVLQSGWVEINVPMLGEDLVFRLLYTASASYAESMSHRSCLLSVKFDEPNPRDRSL